jgi:16S rRNA (uracil1498-N3)-methyltransferase
MRRLLCPRIPAPGCPVLLTEDEARHAVRVLRLREGDLTEAIDGRGGAAVARVRLGAERSVTLEFESGLERTRTAAPELVLELAVLKGEAMEWAVEKAVELGITRLQPVLTAHGVVQIDRKGPEAFRDRWQRIADQALKQCGRLESMPIGLPVPLEQLLQEEASRLWCDERDRDRLPSLAEALGQAQTPLHLLIGPEGGWSETERSLLSAGTSSARPVSLGPRVLRAETAAIYVASVAGAWLEQRDAKLDKSRQKKES